MIAGYRSPKPPSQPAGGEVPPSSAGTSSPDVRSRVRTLAGFNNFTEAAAKWEAALWIDYDLATEAWYETLGHLKQSAQSKAASAWDALCKWRAAAYSDPEAAVRNLVDAWGDAT